VDLLRADKAALAKAKALEGEGHRALVPAPAVFELWEGIERSRHPPRELFAVRDLLQDYPQVALEPRHAMRAGTLSGALARRGIVLEDVDCLIAGIALEERAPVLTRNVADFRRVEGLRVETY
jgi:tRNA(fMet)-specific endonuclease VapC